MTYSQACELALQYSIINPHRAYFVNWIEDAEYIVETEPEHNGQCFSSKDDCYEFEGTRKIGATTRTINKHYKLRELNFL